MHKTLRSALSTTKTRHGDAHLSSHHSEGGRRTENSRPRESLSQKHVFRHATGPEEDVQEEMSAD